MPRPRLLLLAATSLLALAACDAPPTEPEARVTLTADTGAPTSLHIDGAWRVACPVTLRASADGGSLAWTGGTLVFRSAGSGALLRTVPLDRDVAADVLGGAEISRGGTLVSSLELWADEPFELQGSFTYRSAGRESAASVSLRCAPSATP